MKRLGVIIIFFFGFIGVEARTLSWQEAIVLARQNSAEYQTALSNYQSVLELERTGASGFYPSVRASVSGQESGTPGVTTARTYAAQLSVSQNLFAGLSDINNYYLRKTRTEQAQATLNAAQARLSRELKEAFAQVYYLQDYKKLTSEILQRRKENYNYVRLQYEIGRENKGSLLLSQSYVELAEYDQLTTENSEELAHQNLRRIIGWSDTETISITNNIPREEAPARPDFSVLVQKHPDVVTAKAEESALLNTQKVSRAGFLPSLDLAGSYGYSDSKFFPGNDAWSVGLTLSIPIFSGFSTYGSYRSASASATAGAASARTAILRTENLLKTAYYEYIQALQKEKIDENFNRAAVVRAEVARNKYKNGFLTFEEWDTVETDLISRQKENLSSEKNRIAKQGAWEQAQGIGVF